MLAAHRGAGIVRRRVPRASGFLPYPESTRALSGEDGPPERDDAGRVRLWVHSASRRLRPLGPVFSNPLRCRGARSANGLTVARGVGLALFLPVLDRIHQIVSVVAPVVMWAGRRAVQGPGVGRRPSPGRHVHGRVVRGAHGGGRRVSALLDGAGRRVLRRAEGGGVLGACPVTWRETAWGQSQSLRILGSGVGPGGRLPSPRVGLPQTGRSTGTRRRWSCSSRGLLRVPAAASSRADALEPAPLFAERVLRARSRER